MNYIPFVGNIHPTHTERRPNRNLTVNSSNRALQITMSTIYLRKDKQLWMDLGNGQTAIFHGVYLTNNRLQAIADRLNGSKSRGPWNMG